MRLPGWMRALGLGVGLSAALALALQGQELPLRPPQWVGDPDDVEHAEGHLEAALEATAAFGPWPPIPWRIQIHADAASFEQATGSPPQRGACWVGSTLHLRPWEQLRRRDLGALLRHELVHHRLLSAHLRRWEEEARCLWAETHVRPPQAWPMPPSEEQQNDLDTALARGKTEFQAWAYRFLRAWMEGRPLPAPPERRDPPAPAWESVEAEPPPLPDTLRVTWPEARMPARLHINGRELPRKAGAVWTFQGTVRFGKECPVRLLQGRIQARWSTSGWRISWETSPETWIAAAVSGELGQAPYEAQRSLAAVLRCWLKGHQSTQHADGSLCPLTHCAVVRGMPTAQARRAAQATPELELDPRWAFFTASCGGQSLSPREVWGKGPTSKGTIPLVPGDRWATWERTFTSRQVARLKREVRPGLSSGQVGLRIGPSGPYPVEELRLAAGRAFGWTAWPSNACAAELMDDGSLRVRGHGWGHNAGLCLSWAAEQAKKGRKAEEILSQAFPQPQ